VLDILPTAKSADPELARWVDEQLVARKAARSARNFAEADKIRGALKARGVEIEDTPTGTKWRVL
jgi:cysteinyl-tRNA synthetase